MTICLLIQVNFDQLVAQSDAARRHQQDREARRTVMLQQRIQEIKQEIIGLLCFQTMSDNTQERIMR